MEEITMIRSPSLSIDSMMSRERKRGVGQGSILLQLLCHKVYRTGWNDHVDDLEVSFCVIVIILYDCDEVDVRCLVCVGSGKHQRAAAAAAAAGSSMNNNNNNNTNPTASDSAVTSGGVFAPPTGSQKREQLSVFTAENLSATPPALKIEQQHRRDEEFSDLKEWSSSSDKQKLALHSPLPTQCGNIIGFESTGTPKRTPWKQGEEPLETPVGLRSSSKNRRKGSQPKKTEI
jgi:hypothetical protein